MKDYNKLKAQDKKLKWEQENVEKELDKGGMFVVV